MPEKNRFPAVLQPVAVTGDVAHTLKAEGFDGSEDGTGRGTPIVSVHGTQDPDVREGYAHTLGRNNGQENAIAYSVEVCPTLRSGGNATGGDRPPGTDVDTADSNIVTDLLAVRRLMPVECERLQGFPDNHTSVPDWYECGCGHSFAEELGKYGCPNCCGENVARRKSTVDGPRYMSIGNSKAVPVVQWVGRRLKQELTQCDRY